MKSAALAIIALLAFCGTNASAASAHAEPLAKIAHRLGFVYTYLGPDDVVSLVGHGLSVIVRPGSPYFTVNERVQPIEGDAPRYEGGDLLISPAFSHQLAAIERAAAANFRPSRSDATSESAAHINVAAPGGPPHNVTHVVLTAVPGTDDVSVSGEATPGSLVAIVLKATADPLLPTIFLNRSFAIADSDGRFGIRIATAPAYTTGSTFTAEAAAIDDAQPMIAHYAPPGK